MLGKNYPYSIWMFPDIICSIRIIAVLAIAEVVTNFLILSVYRGYFMTFEFYEFSPKGSIGK